MSYRCTIWYLELPWPRTRFTIPGDDKILSYPKFRIHVWTSCFDPDHRKIVDFCIDNVDHQLWPPRFVHDPHMTSK